MFVCFLVFIFYVCLLCCVCCAVNILFLIAVCSAYKKERHKKRHNSCGVRVTHPSFGWKIPGASPGKSVWCVCQISFIYLFINCLL